VPYQWWRYRSAQMMGLFVRAFCDLPLEAVGLGLRDWTTVLVTKRFCSAFHVARNDFGGCFSSQTRNCANSGNEAEVMVRSCAVSQGTDRSGRQSRRGWGEASRSSFA